MFSFKQRTLAVVAVLGFGGLVVAGDESNLTPEQYCEKHFSNTSLVMELRQAESNSKKEEVRQIASTSIKGEAGILSAIVDEAFKTPYQFSFQERQAEVKDFDNKGYNICLSLKG